MGKRNRKPKTGICALCGKSGQITREHVLPKCLFSRPRPNNTITVPLCVTCNHSYHLDDEYFRVLVACDPNPSPDQWRLWREKVVGSSFSRSGGLKARLQEEHSIVQDYAKTHDFYSHDGCPLQKEMTPLLQGFDARRISSVVDKIVRCLHYDHYDRLLDTRYSIEVLPPVPLRSLQLPLPCPKGQVGHKGEFLYWQFGHTDPKKSVWLLSFYLCHAFAAEVTDTQ